MELRTLYALYDYFRKFLDEDLPARASFSLGTFMSKAEADCKEYVDQRNNLVKKYATPTEELDEDGNPLFSIPTENMKTFLQELEKLDTFIVEAPTMVLYMEDLNNLKLTPRDYAILTPYIKE